MYNKSNFFLFYKYVSVCISYRINSTLDTRIANTQTGFIQGRFISENTKFIYDWGLI